MNLLDVVSHREFIVKLFPQGLTEVLMVGQVRFDPLGNTTVALHTRQQPALDVKKWGKWGEDYNTIVIILSSSRIKEFSVSNISGALYSKVELFEVEGGFRFSQQSDDWSFYMVFEDIGFDSCEVYIDGADDVYN
ncbi:MULTISPECIES: hypothetical protein [Pseudomonas]|uniref:Uncharacterized protein n=1 Tax=Pseudomonas quercus TaxID=2722792 RepID=A0ABX0YE90_9PSED|nr:MULTISPECIES: hypothetical protein [Pseudomonas]MBF7142702.1 hypothetical protein [Pseudomonas sp. LY10J]NJP01240.1 hypothetical protein [Pseudomonas quercus]